MTSPMRYEVDLSNLNSDGDGDRNSDGVPMSGPQAQGMRPLTEAVQHKGGPEAQGMRPLTEAVQHKGGPGAQGTGQQKQGQAAQRVHANARFQRSGDKCPAAANSSFNPTTGD
eukprot:gene19918-26622_t